MLFSERNGSGETALMLAYLAFLISLLFKAFNVEQLISDRGFEDLPELGY